MGQSKAPQTPLRTDVKPPAAISPGAEAARAAAAGPDPAILPSHQAQEERACGGFSLLLSSIWHHGQRFRVSPSSRDNPRFPCTSLFPGQKNLPLAEANSHGCFLDLYTPQQDSSDDCEPYYIFFLIAFLLQAFLVETVFRQERIQTSWKALCRAASPWMLHFYFWEVSFRFEETQEILCS